LYSNPDNSGFITLSDPVNQALPCGDPAGTFISPAPGAVGQVCASLTAIPKQGNVFHGIPYGVHDEISPGSTPFAAQFGVRFKF
jgi:hypothetical protein